MTVGVAITNGVVVVTCDVQRGDVNDQRVRREIYARALDVAQVFPDLMALANAQPVTVLLHTYVDEAGTPAAVIVKDSSVGGLITAYTKDGTGVELVINKVLEEPVTLIALRDLIASLGHSHLSAVNCARAVETIRSLVAGPGGDTKKRKLHWATFNSVLNLSDDFTKLIMDRALGPRHGDHSVVLTDAEQSEIKRRAWLVMDRFLEYRKRDNQPLPLSDFPLLT
jgi:hypothetical protein